MIYPRWKYCVWVDICFGVTWLHLLASTDLSLFNCPLVALPQHTELWRRGKENCSADSYAGGSEVNPRSGNWQRWDLSLFFSTTSWKSWDSASNRLQYKLSRSKYIYSSADGLFSFLRNVVDVCYVSEDSITSIFRVNLVHLENELVGINSMCQLGGEIKENVANVVSAQMWNKFSRSEDGGSPFLLNVGTLICHTRQKPWRPSTDKLRQYFSIALQNWCLLIN